MAALHLPPLRLAALWLGPLWLGLLWLGAAASAQAVDPAAPNPLLTLSFSSSLNVSDNYDLDTDPAGTTTFLDNTAGLTYRTETATQRLAFGASGVYRLANIPETGSDADFDNPTLNVDYARTGADAEITARATYNRADISFFDPLSLVSDGEDILDEDLTPSGGTREFTSGRIGFRTGLSSPLGFNGSAQTQRRDYIDATDPGLYDTTNTDYLLGTSLALSPVTGISLTGRQSDYSADDTLDTDRTNRSVFASLAQDIGPALVLRGSLGHQVINSDETRGAIRGTTTQEGIIGSIGLDRTLPGGVAGVLLDQTVSLGGTRNALRFSRGIDLPTGQISASLGASKPETGKATMIGDIRYEQALRTGSLFLRLARTAGANSRDEDVETTTAQAVWQQELSPVSGMTLSLDYVSLVNPVSTDSDRGRFRASYSRDLTPDWQVTGGYEYSSYDREGTGFADSNEIFLTIGRDFRIRP